MLKTLKMQSKIWHNNSPRERILQISKMTIGEEDNKERVPEGMEGRSHSIMMMKKIQLINRMTIVINIRKIQIILLIKIMTMRLMMMTEVIIQLNRIDFKGIINKPEIMDIETEMICIIEEPKDVFNF